MEKEVNSVIGNCSLTLTVLVKDLCVNEIQQEEKKKSLYNPM